MGNIKHMFKAVNKETGEGIILLAAMWNGQEQLLYSMCRKDLLVCQECRQPVWARTGEIRRWHFSHKHKQNCTLQTESIELLKARSALYLWLVKKFGEQAVDIEKKYDEYLLPRPIDCIVQVNNKVLVYWIIDKEMRPSQREQLIANLEGANTEAMVNYIFTSRTLQASEEDTEKVILSTTQREFARRSIYDQTRPPYLQSQGKSIHYIHGNEKIVTTYRGLHVSHGTLVFEGIRLISSFDDLLVSGKTGEFVHPGEQVLLSEIKEKLKKERDVYSFPQINNNVYRPHQIDTICQDVSLGAGKKEVAEKQISEVTSIKLICEFCGQKTDDWWYKIDNNTCRCRACYRNGKA